MLSKSFPSLYKFFFFSSEHEHAHSNQPQQQSRRGSNRLRDVGRARRPRRHGRLRRDPPHRRRHAIQRIDRRDRGTLIEEVDQDERGRFPVRRRARGRGRPQISHAPGRRVRHVHRIEIRRLDPKGFLHVQEVVHERQPVRTDRRGRHARHARRPVGRTGEVSGCGNFEGVLEDKGEFIEKVGSYRVGRRVEVGDEGYQAGFLVDEFLEGGPGEGRGGGGGGRIGVLRDGGGVEGGLELRRGGVVGVDEEDGDD